MVTSVMDPVIERVMELAQPAKPELYRAYLSALDRERLSALAVSLEADAKNPPSTPQRYRQLMGSRSALGRVDRPGQPPKLHFQES